jgi:Tol biopolymer transport system component
VKLVPPLVLFVAAGLILSGCASGHPTATTSSAAPVVHHPGVPAGHIVFRRYLDVSETTGALFVTDTDGNHEVQLTHPHSGEVDGDPDWSPDGSKIIFQKIVNGGDNQDPNEPETHQIVEINSDGTGTKALTVAKPPAGQLSFNDQPVFSPDGKSIAYTHGDGALGTEQLTNTGVYIMNADGSAPHEVVAMAQYAADIDAPIWSPDGKQLLFNVLNSGTGQPKGGRAFFIVNADGTGSRQLTAWDSGSDGYPDWSSSSGIIFRVAPDEESGIGNFFTINPDGSGLKKVTNLSKKAVGHKVSYSPDATWITYGAQTTAGIQVVVARLDGTVSYVIDPTKREASAPDWSPAN